LLLRPRGLGRSRRSNGQCGGEGRAGEQHVTPI
jgi:hypothetical protein